MLVQFWGLVITPSTPQIVSIPSGFVLNLQNAVLTSGQESTIMVTVRKSSGVFEKWTLGRLRAMTVENVKLDLVFGSDSPLRFEMSGEEKTCLHLTGYFQPGPVFDGDQVKEDEDEKTLLALFQKEWTAYRGDSKKRTLEVKGEEACKKPKGSDDESKSSSSDEMAVNMENTPVEKIGWNKVRLSYSIFCMTPFVNCLPSFSNWILSSLRG